MGDTARTFLTAEWRYLAMVTFETEPALLRPFVPRGTELDTYDGRALLSLVGFRFLRTRVLGCRVPFHHDFEEVNLRLYVRREVHGELRRGVTFIREIVSQLEARGIGHIYVDGGITIQRFLQAGLINRLIITRVPVLIGTGIPLFGPLPRDIPLTHVATRQYASGLVQSEYAVAT